MSRINPRTGIVDLNKNHIQRMINKQLPYNSKLNIINNSISDKILLDLDSLLVIATQIGKVIAQELKDFPVHKDKLISDISVKTSDRKQKKIISIDETIADVGINNSPDLRKGKDSAMLTKIEDQEDIGLSGSKNRLRALKNKTK